MIRVAQISDVMAIVALLKHAHQNSIYRDLSNVRDKDAQQFVMQMLQGMGLKSRHATLVWVAVTDGVVTGIVAAAKSPVYFIGDKLTVQEVYFYGMREVVDRKDMRDLFIRFNTWADGDDRVVEVKVSSSDVFAWLDWHDLRPFYERYGFTRAGDVYVRRVKK
jgi:hypothetical protein